MAATKHDQNIMSMNIQAKSYSTSSIPVQFMDFAFYSYQFSSSSEDNAKDEDSSRRNMLTNTFSLEFSSQATSGSLSYLRH
jgi:glycine/serine hydroxymethyltransferase